MFTSCWEKSVAFNLRTLKGTQMDNQSYVTCIQMSDTKLSNNIEGTISHSFFNGSARQPVFFHTSNQLYTRMFHKILSKYISRHLDFYLWWGLKFCIGSIAYMSHIKSELQFTKISKTKQFFWNTRRSWHNWHCCHFCVINQFSIWC